MVVTWRLLMSDKAGTTDDFDNWQKSLAIRTEVLALWQKVWRFDRWAQEQFAVHGGEVLATGTWRSIRLLASVFNWKFKAVKNYLLNQYIVHNKSPTEPPWYHLFLNEPNLTHYTAQKSNEKMKKHKKFKKWGTFACCTKKFRQSNNDSTPQELHSD